MSAPTTRLLIHAAYHGEVRSLLKTLRFKDKSYARGFSYWETEDQSLSLAVTGEGKSKTEIALSNVLGRIQQSHNLLPLHIINLGVAGALTDSLSLGDLVWADTVYGKFAEPFHPLTFEAKCPFKNKIPYKIVSVERRIDDSQIRGDLSYHADLVDMECHSVGLVAKTFGYPFSVCKVVSDFANNSSQCDLVSKNADFYSEILCEEFLRTRNFFDQLESNSVDTELLEVSQNFHLSVSQTHQLAKLHKSCRISGQISKFRAAVLQNKVNDASGISPKQSSRKLLRTLVEILNPLQEFAPRPTQPEEVNKYV
jgi:nucleoside phosphorylase